MIIDRRHFLFGPLLPLLVPISAVAEEKFEIQYSDDTTGIQTVQSQYNSCSPFRIEKLYQSIDESISAGIDKFILQPGVGWVPWWKSDFYSAVDHYRWIERRYATQVADIAAYMMTGGDIVGEAVGHCKRRGIPLYVSIRLNDVHGLQFSGADPEQLSRLNRSDQTPAARQLRGLQNIPRIHQERPEWRLNPSGTKVDDQAWNWGIPEVVEWRRRQLVELCQRYPIDGLQLDFMRYPRFFREDAPEANRLKIMRDFVHAVRSSLGKRILSVRIPKQISEHRGLGIDINEFIAAGVGEITASAYSVTSQELDWDAWRSFADKARLFIELTNYVSRTPKRMDESDPNTAQIPTSEDQFLSTAALARRFGGFAGASLFNFRYYRRVCAIPGMSGEPPFGVIKKMGGAARAVPESYFLGWIPARLAAGQQLPARVEATLVMWAAQVPRQGILLLAFGDWRHPGANISPKVSVKFNGRPVDQAPLPRWADRIVGLSEACVAFTIPVGALRDGPNHVNVRPLTDRPFHIGYAELRT